MFKLECPSCQERFLAMEMGSRREPNGAGWFKFQRRARVCPYCNGSVRWSSSPWWLAVPIILYVILAIALVVVLVLYDIESTWPEWVFAAVFWTGAWFWIRRTFRLVAADPG